MILIRKSHEPRAFYSPQNRFPKVVLFATSAGDRLKLISPNTSPVQPHHLNITQP